MKFLYLLPVFAILITSGCINWPGRDGNNFIGGEDVVKVIKINPGSTNLFSTEPYTLEARVKNADTNLLNPLVKTKVFLSNPTCEVESVDTAFCPLNSHVFGKDRTTGWGCKDIDLPPIGDTETGEQVFWNIKFKQRNVTGLSPQCTFDVITEYEYETSSLTNVQFKKSPSERQLREPTKGTGPVKVYFKVEEQQPIKVTAEKRPFRINLYVEKVKRPSGDEKEVRLVNNQVDLTDIDFLQKFKTATCTINGKDFKPAPGDNLQGLDGDTSIFPCKAETPTDEDSFDVSVKSKYTYQIVYKTPEITVTYR